MKQPKQKKIVETIDEKISKDLEDCEESVNHFSYDNKFAAGIARYLKRIQDILKSENIKDESTLRHDIKNPLGAALSYADMLKVKVENEKEKFKQKIYINL